MGRNWNAHQKSGQIVAWLILGSRLSTRDIARQMSMTYQGAKYMMVFLSLTLPIAEVDGKWEWLGASIKDYSVASHGHATLVRNGTNVALFCATFARSLRCHWEYRIAACQ